MSRKELELKVGFETVVIGVGDYIIDHYRRPDDVPGQHSSRYKVEGVFDDMVKLDRWPCTLTSMVMEFHLASGNYTIEENLDIDVEDTIINRSSRESFTVKSVCEDGDYYIKKNGSGGIPVLWRKNMARHAVKNNKITIKKKRGT